MKIMLSLILLATIPTHAISKTLGVVPPDAVDSLVWTKFSLNLLPAVAAPFLRGPSSSDEALGA